MTPEEIKKLESDYKKFESYKKRLEKLKADKEKASIVDYPKLARDFESIKADYDKDFGLPSEAKGSVTSLDAAEKQAMLSPQVHSRMESPQ